ncbi:MAG TPA: type II toxin-antitoxin system VapC family toxin [Candidatus Cybelea sp.]|nr:type II toxin-antitoxin system VapC family toxin [Candidatus Cybelea sp.]
MLDTHVWLWMALEPRRLGEVSRSMIADRTNALFLSIASTWEMVVKQSRGKLELPADAATYLRSRLPRSGATLLDVSLDHVVALDSIPDRHRDPFDRMLVAQALVEGMKLMSADPRVLAYPVETIDARR